MKVKILLLIVSGLASIATCKPPDRHGDSHIDENEYYVEESTPSQKVSFDDSSIASPYIKMYVENSGSMDGYVNGGSDLRDVVQAYLYDIEMSEMVPIGMSCFFVNDRIIPMGDDVEDFTQKINPSQFKKSGGKRGKSDLADIFKKIMPGGDTVALLVSDCIFSPGKEDANHYVIGQYNQIKHLFHGVAKNSEMSVLIYRFEGDFKGTYYDCMDKPSKFEGKRPFFLIAIGKDEHIKDLRAIEDKLPLKIQNRCIITHFTKELEYAVLPLSDGYRVKRDNNHVIEKAKLSKGKGSRRGNEKTLSINVGVDLSELIVNEQYLMDTSNWETSNASYKVMSVDKSNNANHTHILKIITASNNKASVDIMLKNQMPRWIYRFNDEDCGAATPQDGIQTTFGLKKMVQGMFDAFTDKADYLCKLTISVNQ